MPRVSGLGGSSASCEGGSLTGQHAKTTQTHPSRDTSPGTGSLNCGFLMQLFDKYLSLLYCKAIRTASEVGLLKRHHKKKTIWIMNVSIYFPLIRTLLKAPAEAGISQSFVYMSGAAQRLKFTSLFSLTSCWFYPSVHPLKLPACTGVRESWADFNQAAGCNLEGLSFSIRTCSHLQPEKEGPSPCAGCWVSL